VEYGYGRVSTVVQDASLQRDAFVRAGVSVMVLEKASGAAARPRLRALLERITVGDVVTVWKLDRLGRSLQDLLAILDELHSKGAAFRSLSEPVDTRPPAGKLMFSVLGAVAEFERSIIRERCFAGQIAAFRRGVKLGRRRHSTPPEVVAEMRAIYATGNFTYPEVGALFNLHGSTAKRLITGRSSRKRMPVLGRLLDEGRK
jgi:DNA invertase Pin-like site-specific DNA recombinase